MVAALTWHYELWRYSFSEVTAILQDKQAIHLPQTAQTDVDKQVFFQSTPKPIEISKQFLTGYSKFLPECHESIKEWEIQGEEYSLTPWLKFHY